MDSFITASYEELKDQASMTAKLYLLEASAFIDMQFGEGYAKKNPELVAAFMRVASDDFNVAAKIKSDQGIVQFKAGCNAERIAE